MKYKKCCICAQPITPNDGHSSTVAGRVHLTCANGAINYAHELARINKLTLPAEFPNRGMINHFRDNLGALSHGECAQREMHERMYGRDPDAPSPELLCATLQNMQRNGGSFVKALADAWSRADPENSRRLRVAFPEYWARYSAAAKEGE